MPTYVTPSKPIPFDGHPVYGSGLTAIHEGYLLAYARTVQGSSFSCYQWTYWHSAHKVTVFKRGEAITIQRME